MPAEVVEAAPTSDEGGRRMRAEMERFVAAVEKADAEAQAGSSAYTWEFLGIRAENEELRELDEFSTSVGEMEAHLPKNRYRDILPYDYSRVTLDPMEPFANQGDYINASFINGASGRVSYIAAQGPVAESLCDFWRMILQYSVQLIVMVCNVDEYGKRKCEQYWPETLETPLELAGGVKVAQVEATAELGQDLLQRFFRVTVPAKNGGRPLERIVRQLHYTCWPDHGAPETAEPILHLLSAIRAAQPYDRTPILAHCSAGCGRTGTIIALDFVRAMLQQGLLGKSSELSMSQIVLELRRQRPAMVQTPDQYIVLHRCVAALFRQQLALVEDHHYHNLPLSAASDDASSSSGSSLPDSPPLIATATTKEAEAAKTGNGTAAANGGSEKTEKKYALVGGMRIPDYPSWPEAKPKGPPSDKAPSPTKPASPTTKF